MKGLWEMPQLSDKAQITDYFGHIRQSMAYKEWEF